MTAFAVWVDYHENTMRYEITAIEPFDAGKRYNRLPAVVTAKDELEVFQIIERMNP